MENTERLRLRLQTRLGELIRQHASLEASLRHADGELSDDWEERAALLQNNEVWEALESSDREEIRLIQGALERLRAGNYDRCTVCGESIPARRLEVLPYTDRCVSCA